MDFCYFTIMSFSVALAIYANEQRKKKTKFKSQFEKTEQMLKDTIKAKAQLIATRKIYNLLSVNVYAWEVRKFTDGVLVGEFSKDGFPVVIARWFPYDLPMSQDDIEYKYNCAIELLEKLTEKV